MRAFQNLILCAVLLSAVSAGPVPDPPTASPCPVTTKTPKPAGLRCGGAFKPKIPRSTKAIISVDTESSLPSCQTACFELTACKSFTLNTDDDGTCTLFRRIGKRMGMDSSTDGTRFYSKDCFERRPEDTCNNASSVQAELIPPRIIHC